MLVPKRDLDFFLYDWLDLESLFSQPRYADQSRETTDAFIELSEQLATDLFLPFYKEADKHEPYLDEDGVHILPGIKDALHHFGELGLFSAGFSPQLGGMGLPYLACSASFSLFASANLAAGAYAMLTMANARLITIFGSEAQIEQFAKPQIEGRWFGTMCLSEPQAGSSLADVRTRAEPDGADDLGQRYRLVGNKMWISGGDQDASENIVHLVLAKIPGADGELPQGSRGISLFIVPKHLPDGARNDVVVAGLNHKMGYRGTANCLLNFGERGGAVGWLVGQPGDGLRQMFQMMNEARIGVGMGAAAVGYRGYRHAVQYARERLQGRRIGETGGPPIAIIEHPDVRHMLLAQKAYAEGALAICFYCSKLVDEEQGGDEGARVLLGLLTPVCKTWPSEYGLMTNDLAIQVHGGYGYTRDFDVEQLYRDNRLNPIHEGTTGIQAVDLLGRKILRDNGAGMAELRRRAEVTMAKAAALPALAAYGQGLDAKWARIVQVIDGLRQAPGAHAFDNAAAFLRAFGHFVIGWLWLDQAVTASAGDGADPFIAGKLRVCRYFFEIELPHIETWLDLVESGSDVASGAPPEIF